MKKIFAAVAAALMTLFFAACAAAAGAPALDEVKPWGLANAYEQSEYKVQIFERITVTDAATNTQIRANGAQIGGGAFVQTFSSSGDNGLGTLTSALDVQWDDTEKAGVNRNAHDVSGSSVTFYTANCTPVSSQKTMTLSDRTVNGAVVNNSYTYTADYDALTANVKFGKSGAAAEGYLDEKEFPIPSGLMYDNEQLFYLIRAFSGLTTGAQITFPLSSAINLYEQNKKKPDAFNMLAQVLTTTGERELGDFFPDRTPETSGDDTDIIPSEGAEPAGKDAPVTCYDVRLVINDQNSGPAHCFWITQSDIRFRSRIQDGDDKPDNDLFLTTSKLVAGYEYLVFDETGTDIFQFVYTLNKYNNM